MTAKKITLYGSATTNGGSFIDAGATVSVGDDAAEISAQRAQELVDGGRAASETAAKSAAKA